MRRTMHEMGTAKIKWPGGITPSGHFEEACGFKAAALLGRILELRHRLQLILGRAEYGVIRIPRILLDGRRSRRGRSTRRRARAGRRTCAAGRRLGGGAGIGDRLLNEL